MPSWYDTSLLLLHLDHRVATAETVPPNAGLDRDRLARILERLRPDAVQYPAKGPNGLALYPTRFGNRHPALPDPPEPDLLEVYREVTRERGIRLIVGYAGLVDAHAANQRPEWMRTRFEQMPYPNRALCPNGGYVEELMLPQLEEILERYQPDGIWVDGENWSVSPCYCPACLSEFQALHGRSAPSDRSDPFWPEWLDFHRTSFRRYLARVGRFLHDRDPELLYASNAAFATHQPEALAEGPDRLTWDLSPAYSLRQAGMEARFFAGRGVPFDLMTWSECSARPWPVGSLPALPVYPKSFDHLAQEGAVILANGGRWTIWLTVHPDGALPESRCDVPARAAAFAREREPWCRGSESAAPVAVLHSASTHQTAGNGLYDPGPSLDRIRGAHQALQELHVPHDIRTADDLLREIDRYRVILLPEQVWLPHELDDPLLAWVRRGGRLIATGRVSPRIIEDIPTFALEEALGVQWTGQQESEGWMLHRGLPLRIAAPCYRVAIGTAHQLVPWLLSGHEDRIQESGYPAVTWNAFGEGEAYYIATDLCTAYHRCQYPGLREVLGDVLERALARPPLLTTAPASVEAVLRRRDGALLLHLVEHSPGKSLAQNSAFVESVPLTQPFTVTLSVPEEPVRVRLQPGDREPEWSYSEGTLTVVVPPFHIHAILEVL